MVEATPDTKHNGHLPRLLLIQHYARARDGKVGGCMYVVSGDVVSGRSASAVRCRKEQVTGSCSGTAKGFLLTST